MSSSPSSSLPLFLYCLIHRHLAPGVVEDILSETLSRANWPSANEHLAAYCESLAERLNNDICDSLQQTEKLLRWARDDRARLQVNVDKLVADRQTEREKLAQWLRSRIAQQTQEALGTTSETNEMLAMEARFAQRYLDIVLNNAYSYDPKLTGDWKTDGT